ncbi:MAG: excinuclease ABC subunit UvrC [Holosporales bacterium]|nr:excinuclease ABC subunit UvrC [Holosporales bacterium]
MGTLLNAITIIRNAAKQAGSVPGVYKMIGSRGSAIYIGKAKNLRNRLLSYTNLSALSNRIKMMISDVQDVEVVVVNSEVEAFLLESNLIKEMSPFYNILLKDDKTFPYIVIDSTHEFPRLFKYRTLRPKSSDFFGPYPSVSALDDTIKLIQKMFLIRNCSDSQFASRKRPCLQYYIKRCSAPCVHKISSAEYARGVAMARLLLCGKESSVRSELTSQMRNAAELKNFEYAAVLRDKIRSLSDIQAKQYIQIDDLRSIDFIALQTNRNGAAVAGITFLRAGRNVGFEAFTLENANDNSEQNIIASFITQFYRGVNVPECIVTDCDLSKNQLLTEFFAMMGVNPKLTVAKQGVYRRIMDSCKLNANMRLRKNDGNQIAAALPELSRLLGRQNRLRISKPPESELLLGDTERRSGVYIEVHEHSSTGSTQQETDYGGLVDGANEIHRVEVYDNSHTQGTNACGVMIVFEGGAIQKSKLRKFNIPDNIASGGDDIAMMKFVLHKRFASSRIPEVPDLIVVDGGITQLTAVKKIVEEFGLTERVSVIGIAKQNNRKIGDEKIVFGNGLELSSKSDMGENTPCADNTLLLSSIIMLRNEAHRAAIGFHRKKRSVAMSRSIMDSIPSVGKFRKRLLLEHFGSFENIRKASLEDIKMVKGISSKIAEAVFRFAQGHDE